MAKSFVFLNVYCKSVKDEHAPRGPEGPYRFKDRSVPVLVIKRWDGKTLKQQLGFYNDPKLGQKTLARIIDKAVKDNGPVAPPKALRPLLEQAEKAKKALSRQRIKAAVRAYQKVVKAGADKKKFADGPPTVAIEAAHALEKLEADGTKAVEQVLAGEANDPKSGRKKLNRLLYRYGGFPDLKKRIKTALAALR
jgi:hypothetical protein